MQSVLKAPYFWSSLSFKKKYVGFKVLKRIEIFPLFFKNKEMGFSAWQGFEGKHHKE